jgi:hypothetical protein
MTSDLMCSVVFFSGVLIIFCFSSVVTLSSSSFQVVWMFIYSLPRSFFTNRPLKCGLKYVRFYINSDDDDDDDNNNNNNNKEKKVYSRSYHFCPGMSPYFESCGSCDVLLSY